MHHTVDHPSSGSLVRLARGDTLEVLLRQRSGRHQWQVAMSPYGMHLLEDDAPGGDLPGPEATRRLMFRVMRDGGGILRLEGSHPAQESAERLDLLVAVGR